eukprot:TRINITY_DN5282_c0_g1_i1.p1 TRINITY_DN5282_c0_g1~~TRINITY_DN5282_c0_g1_i1.p1  ORF type:complete len:181 (-),score=39.36 TRINITY_DN5282_c0_g1_i1:163-705(-)
MLLRAAYPEYPWSEADLNRKNVKSQNLLHAAVLDLFPGVDVHLEYSHPGFLFERTGKAMQLDVFVPSMRLAFEYQGRQHYADSPLLGEVGPIRIKDTEKKELCERNGITLIQVPYWWNGSKDSLLATIREFRPNLVLQRPQDGTLPITASPFVTKGKKVGEFYSTPIRIQNMQRPKRPGD